MALINKDNTLFLGAGNYNLRPLSYTKDIHNFEDTDYWYAEFFNHDSISYLTNPDVLSTDTLERLRNKTCILMLNNAHEAFHTVVRPIYDVAVIQLNIPPEQIVLISESAVIDKEVEKIATEYNLGKIKTEWMRLFEHDTMIVEHNPISTLEHKNYNKKFISFNRRWRLHRPALVGLLELNELLDKGYVSLAKADDGKDWDVFYDEMTWTLRHNSNFVNIFVQNKNRLKNIPELKLDQADMTVNHAHIFTDSTDIYYENTYFSVVSETNFFKETGQGLFVSEKIFRPILKKHPFILLSRPYTLNMMQNIGYKTFESIINEDYDSEEDDCKRMLMVVDEIKRLCNLSNAELQLFLNEAKHITEYNYQILLNKKEFLTRL
jgi:uncharacterized protein YneF (UPF0154 family)